jgi:hypothetical protein
MAEGVPKNLALLTKWLVQVSQEHGTVEVGVGEIHQTQERLMEAVLPLNLVSLDW